MRVLAGAAALLTMAGAAQAATMVVDFSSSGLAEMENCADLGCLLTGEGDGSGTTSGAYDLDVLLVALPAATRIEDAEGRRSFGFYGEAQGLLGLGDLVFGFTGSIRVAVSHAWPLYGDQVHTTAYLALVGALDTGQAVAWEFVGETSGGDPASPPEMDPFAGIFADNLLDLLTQPAFAAGAGFGVSFHPQLAHVVVGVDDPAPVPLPASAALMGAALAGLALVRRRHR